MRQLKIAKQVTNRESKSLGSYLAEVSRISGPLTSEEEVVLANRIKNGDESAIVELVTANLRFVISVAKQYTWSHAPLGDLINEGNLGLITAARRFDPTRGFKFISYAVWWIRQQINAYLNESGRLMRIPLNKVGLLSKIRKSSGSLEQALGREPTSEEIAQSMIGTKYELNDSEIDALLALDKFPISIDAPVGEDSDYKLSDMLSDSDSSATESLIHSSDQKIKISSMLVHLTTRERDIVVKFFGLEGNPAESLEEIGTALELTRERVRQIKEKSIRKLKHKVHRGTGAKEYLS